MDNASSPDKVPPKPAANSGSGEQKAEVSANQVSPSVEQQPSNEDGWNNLLMLSTEDIPFAQREAVHSVDRFPSRNLVLMGGLVGIGAIALAAGALLAMQLQSPPPTASTPEVQPSASPSPTPSPSPDSLLGHFPYPEATLADLSPIVPDGSIKLRKAAAKKFLAMVDAARADGVDLVPLSGFRSKQDQDYLFFGVKAERGQGAAQRAQVSAPPGYSEHHTGYAIDVGDGNVPATNLSPTFDKTAAFKWMKENAPYYSFELSFPKGNSQGVSYEPWHWRFVGDRHSLETFYKARSNQPPRQPGLGQSSSDP